MFLDFKLTIQACGSSCQIAIDRVCSTRYVISNIKYCRCDATEKQIMKLKTDMNDTGK
jgi:hypothetical protein